MNLLLFLIIAVPLFSFLLTLMWQNKEEKPIALIVRITKVLNIVIVLVLAGYWWQNGQLALEREALTVYQREHVLFARQL